MRVRTRTSKILNAMLLGLILLVAMPTLSFAQGRGRGRDKKIDKFINGHDARDGRWDGRGPDRGSDWRRRRFSRDRRIWWDRDDDSFGNRRFRRGRYDDSYFSRNRRIDRDGDGDFDRFDVLLGRRNRFDRDGDGDFDRRDVLLGRRHRDRRYNRVWWR